MENIMEWISDNLRYIILGCAVILVIILGVLGMKLIGAVGGKKADKPKTEVQTEASTENTTEGTSEAGSASAKALVQNDSKVLTMMTSYYTAKTNKDMETLVKLDPSIDQEEELENLNASQVESYSNIKTYSIAAPADGSYVVYVSYDGKVVDIDTLVPSLTQYYLKTNSDDLYYIADPSSDEGAEKFIEEVRESSEVKNLIETVNKACEEAQASDPVLKTFMDKFGNKQSSSSDSDKKDSEDTSREEMEEEIMYANDACNVRSVPSTESQDTVIGGVTYGEQVTVKGKSGDWYIIDYNGQDAYVSAEFISTEAEFYGTSTNTSTAEDTTSNDGTAAGEDTAADVTAY